MTEVTYPGPARAVRLSGLGVAASNGETIEVDADVADQLVENHDFERAGDTENPPEDESNDEYAVLNESIDDLEAELDAGDHDGHLADLKRVEEEHKNREGAKEAIDERRRQLAESAGDGEDGGDS